MGVADPCACAAVAARIAAPAIKPSDVFRIPVSSFCVNHADLPSERRCDASSARRLIGATLHHRDASGSSGRIELGLCLNPPEQGSEGFGQLALSALLTTTTLLTTTLLTGLAATIGVLVLLPGGVLTTLLTALMLIVLATVLAALLIALMLATLLALLLIHRCFLGICPLP
jgi:hypothetical protein